MTVVLGLDLSKNGTGIAVGDATCPPRTTEMSFAAGHSRGEVCLALMTFLRDLIALEKPDVIAYEAALFMASGASSAETARLLMGLSTMVEVVATSRRIPHFPVQVQTWRKDFLGHGRPENAKRAALEMCATLGWETGGSHDRAEAAGVWASGHIRYGDRKSMIRLLSRSSIRGMEARA